MEILSNFLLFQCDEVIRISKCAVFCFCGMEIVDF